MSTYIFKYSYNNFSRQRSYKLTLLEPNVRNVVYVEYTLDND
jgi:hypothetical protein